MATQQYSDYIQGYYDAKERQEQKQAQLVQQYNQRPESPANRFLWASTTIEKHTTHNIQMSDVVKALVGVVVAGGIIVLSIIF